MTAGWRTRVPGEGSSGSLRLVGEETVRKTPNEAGLEEKSKTPSGEASGRAGGISEQPTSNLVVQLASPSAPRGKGLSAVPPRSPSSQLSDAKSSIANTINKSKSLIQNKSFSTPKNLPSGASATVVPKRSSSASLAGGPSAAKHQLQRLVEELETPEQSNKEPDKNERPKSVSSYNMGQVMTNGGEKDYTKLKPHSTSSLSTGLKISTSLSSVKSGKGPVNSSVPARKVPASANREAIGDLDHKAVESENTGEPLVKCTDSVNASIQCTKTSSSMAQSPSLLSSQITKLTKGEIPLTVLALSNSSMTQSLPAEQASSLLSVTTDNRSSYSTDSTSSLEQVPITSAFIKDSISQADESKIFSPQIAVTSTSQSITTSTGTPLRSSDSNSSLKSKRSSLVIEPHKKLFPWETTGSANSAAAAPTLAGIGRQKSSFAATPYRKGKSEDLRSAIEVVGKIDSSFQRYKRAAEATNTPATTTESIIKPYRGSRSRELNPTIEAASEKLNQLNSSNLKKISPFEAYRRSRSRELGSAIDQVQNQQTNPASNKVVDRKGRLMSPPPPGLPQSPASLTRMPSPPPPTSRSHGASPQSSSVHNSSELQSDVPNSIVQRAMSPTAENRQTFSNETISTEAQQQIEKTISSSFIAPVSQKKDLNREIPSETISTNTTQLSQRAKTPFERARSKLERKIERAKSPTVFIEHGRGTTDDTVDVATKNMIQNELNSGKYYQQEADKTRDQDRIKKTSGELDRPKSMYKMITSKFNKSTNNVSEENSELVDGAEDKFKLKRPSIFMKGKPEKSSSRSNIYEQDSTNEQSEKKTSHKLSDALNKFLGRKNDDFHKSDVSVNKQTSQIPSGTTSELAMSEREISKKPTRYRGPKTFSKSHENLNKYSDIEIKSRASSVAPEPNVTVESVTKNICDHLSQLESDIITRIESMDNSSDLRSSKSNGTISQNNAPTNEIGHVPVSELNSFCKPTNNLTSSRMSTSKTTSSSVSSVPSWKYPKKASLASFKDGEPVKIEETSRSKSEMTESVRSAPEDGRYMSPTSWGTESVLSAPDDLQEMESDEEESVMDRITRKSFYSRFQDGKRKRSKIAQPTNKFEEDQQLAAAKARLAEDDKRQRESLSPLRATSPFVNPRISVGSSIPEWDTAVTRRSTRRSIPRTISMPPDDYNSSNQNTSDLTISVACYRDNSRDRSSLSMVAANAGAAAGYRAAERRSMQKEPSTNYINSGSSSYRSDYKSNYSEPRIRSPSPPNRPSMCSHPPPEDTVTSARDELSKRLTPLTRLANTAGTKPYRRTTTTGNLNLSPETTTTPYRQTSYKRTTTSSIESPQESSSSTLPRPSYRRTNTMNLPSVQTSVTSPSRPSDFRHLLQPVNRRYSTTR